MNYEVNIWQVLGIPDTRDKKQIKKAYAKKLKVSSPEKDPESFKRLRWAYEQALDLINRPLSGEGEELIKEIVSDSVEHKLLTSESVNFNQEILRCLSLSLEAQACAYLDEMAVKGELDSMSLRQTLEKSVIDYLYHQETNQDWPSDFVRYFVTTLDLINQAKQDREIAKHLDYFEVRIICKENGWGEEDYFIQQDFLNQVDHVFMDIRKQFIEEGDTYAIDRLDAYVAQDYFKDYKFVAEFRKRYLTELNHYFPGIFPLALSECIEAQLNLSCLEGDDDFEERLANLNLRKAASLEVEQYKVFIAKHPSSVKSLCYKVFFGDLTLNKTLSKKTPHIYKEIKKFVGNLASFSKTVRQYELIHGSDLEDIRDWLVFVESINKESFRKNVDELNENAAKLKRMGKLIAFIVMFSSCFFLFRRMGFLSGLDEMEDYLYVMTPWVSSLFVLACIYHTYDRYLSSMIKALKHRVSIDKKKNLKLSFCFFVISLILALVLSYLDLLVVYIAIQIVVCLLFLTPRLALLMVILPFLPSVNIIQVDGLQTQGDMLGVVIYALCVWVMYVSYLWIKKKRFELNPSASPKLIAEWAAITAFYTLLSIFVFP